MRASCRRRRLATCIVMSIDARLPSARTTAVQAAAQNCAASARCRKLLLLECVIVAHWTPSLKPLSTGHRRRTTCARSMQECREAAGGSADPGARRRHLDSLAIFRARQPGGRSRRAACFLLPVVQTVSVSFCSLASYCHRWLQPASLLSSQVKAHALAIPMGPSPR